MKSSCTNSMSCTQAKPFPSVGEKFVFELFSVASCHNFAVTFSSANPLIISILLC